MAIRLSKTALDRLTPDASKRLEIADAGQPGLYLVIQPSGRKSWAVRYRVGGQSRKLTLNGFPPVATARKLAQKALAAVARGQDPAAAKKMPRSSPNMRGGDPGALINSERPAFQIARYWLLNDTYIDLAVPSEKIGMPFDENSVSRASALSDHEKMGIVEELSKCEPRVRAGDLDMLELALEICRRCEISPPLWLLPHILKTINKLSRNDVRTRQHRKQREIHQIRWAAVHHLRASRGLTWEAAYEAAHQELSRTRAFGSPETIRASYKWMNRHLMLKSIRKDGLPGEIDAFALEQYTNRQAASERLVSSES